jgi:H+-transporting ATPase
LDVCGLTFAFGVVATGKYALGFNIAQLRTLAFITLVFAGQATIYVVRERRHMWCSRPGSWLVVSSLLDLSIAGALAISGTLMAPLSALTVAVVLSGAMVFSVLLDAVKQVTFKCFKIA